MPCVRIVRRHTASPLSMSSYRIGASTLLEGVSFPHFFGATSSLFLFHGSCRRLPLQFRSTVLCNVFVHTRCTRRSSGSFRVRRSARCSFCHRPSRTPNRRTRPLMLTGVCRDMRSIALHLSGRFFRHARCVDSSRLPCFSGWQRRQPRCIERSVSVCAHWAGFVAVTVASALALVLDDPVGIFSADELHQKTEPST